MSKLIDEHTKLQKFKYIIYIQNTRIKNNKDSRKVNK